MVIVLSNKKQLKTIPKMTSSKKTLSEFEENLINDFIGG